MRKGKTIQGWRKPVLILAAFLFLVALAASAETKQGNDQQAVLQLAPADTFETRPFTITIQNSAENASAQIRPLNLRPNQIQLYPQSRTNGPAKTSSFGNTLFTTSLIASSLLQAADFFTTMKALQYESLREANPLMKPFVDKPYAFAAVKVGMVTLNYVLMKNLYKKDKTMAWVISAVTNFAFSYVVAHNLQMIDRAQAQHPVF